MSVTRIAGGVTAAKGFKAAGCEAGIKKAGRADMAMIASDVPCVLAGTFTTNVVKAAPVLWDKEIVQRGTGRAVVVNAGIANACTGKEGMEYCERTAREAASYIGAKTEEVLVASTGVIGQQLPIDRILSGVKKLSGTLSDTMGGGRDAAKAIMTTDTVPKECAVSVTLTDGTEITIGGCAKGSGMIHPNMCTMLCFLTTDAAISQEMLQKALSSVVPDTFNMISVDGDTSTNDTCILMANALAGNNPIEEEGEDYRLFTEGLYQTAETIAKVMAKDGEGATSILTKAAIAGHDANFGRLLCALGYSGVVFDPERVSLVLESAAGRLLVYDNGVPLPFDEEYATKILSQDEIRCIADMKCGSASATAWGCDLTHEYVSINADYRS